MAIARRTYTGAEEISLTTQVDGHCPLCGKSLFYKKKGKVFKSYELAHVFPLNPTAIEAAILVDVERLSADVNDPDNIIPLCRPCHTKYDKPRTVEEYNELADKKRQLIARSNQRALYSDYPIEANIRQIIDGLAAAEPVTTESVELEYDPKRLNDKFDVSLPIPTRQKIKNAVSDYYQYVRRGFRELERTTPNSSQLIFTQVRAFYLKQKTMTSSQHMIFTAVVEWVRMRAAVQTIEGAEIVASFFVQNCEVFE